MHRCHTTECSVCFSFRAYNDRGARSTGFAIDQLMFWGVEGTDGTVGFATKRTSSSSARHFALIQGDLAIDQHEPNSASVRVSANHKTTLSSPHLMPSARRLGSSKVALSLILAGSKRTRSAAEPTPTKPRCGNTPRRLAGRDVTCETISSIGTIDMSRA